MAMTTLLWNDDSRHRARQRLNREYSTENFYVRRSRVVVDGCLGSRGAMESVLESLRRPVDEYVRTYRIVPESET